MQLRDYLRQEGLTATAFGAKMRLSHAAVVRWMNGTRRISAERAIEIERATQGAVTRHDLRPDLYPRDEAAD